MERVKRISRHLAAETLDETERTAERNDCIGEMENRQVETGLEDSAVRGVKNPDGLVKRKGNSHRVLRYRFTRIPIKIAFPDLNAADERYAGSGDMAIIEGELIRPPTASGTVHIFMHPSGIQNLLPMPVTMARAGLHVITCCSRYPNNDSCLIMEKVVIDLGECIRYAKEKLKYKKVILCGWSGGGSLSSFYQAQAENPTVTHTPAGDRIDLQGANLIPADALMIMAAHISRAKIFTEWIDPAVLDENDPSKRDRELDIFDPTNPNKPPYTKDFIAKFRAAQVARNKRITKWVHQRLDTLREESERNPQNWTQSRREESFLVHCTQADLRRLDTSIDPNGRSPTPIAQLAAENHSPVGLARFSTLRSWLSQWSFEESNADGPASLKNVTVPVLVLANEADHLVPLSHPEAMYNAVRHDLKRYVLIKGAGHYYFGQTDLMVKAIQEVIDWSRNTGMLESSFTDEV